jgi:TRAP-type mannitol/chloroaromatic compound transport system substrate-binding protein
MEQMTERMLAKMDSFQEQMKTDPEEMKEAIRTNQEKKDTTLKEIIAQIRAFQEATEVCLDSKEPTSVETESES